MSRVDVEQLAGQTIASITGMENGSSSVQIELEDGRKFEMYHEQGCCESVYLEDVAGDPQDLIGTPLLVVEEVQNEPDPGPLGQYDESYQWTFYRFVTIKGSVTLRWYGTSNGYYGTGVSFFQLD